MLRDKLVGIWTLVGAEFRRSDGAVADLYGPNPSGMIVYGSGGEVAVQIMRAGRPSFSGDDLRSATAAEAQAAVGGYMAYFGRYDVDEVEGSVTHHLRGSIFPNWIGADLKRFYEISSSRLTLRTVPLISDGQPATGVLVWERLSTG